MFLFADSKLEKIFRHINKALDKDFYKLFSDGGSFSQVLLYIITLAMPPPLLQSRLFLKPLHVELA